MYRSLLLPIFIVCFLQSGFPQSQSGKVIYKVDIQPGKFQKSLESSDTPKNASFAKFWYHKIESALPYLQFQLEFTKNEALFTSQEVMDNDNGIDVAFAKKYNGTQGVFYTSIKENTKLHQLNYLNRTWLIERPTDKLTWHISNQTKQIKGYTCYKATTTAAYTYIPKGKVIAWFAPELPFQFGPMSYAGLPGLILELNHVYFHFYADKINLNKKSLHIQSPTKGQRISASTYNKKRHQIGQRLRNTHKN